MRLIEKPKLPRSTLLLRLIKWRTLFLIEKVDADARQATWDRLVTIPNQTRALATEKVELMDQLEKIVNELNSRTTTPKKGIAT